MSNTDLSIDDISQNLLNLSINDCDIDNLDLNNMATITAAKEIAHTLKTFTGKPEHLEFFINSIDRFYNRYFVGQNDDALKEFVISCIQSKIIDEAGDFLLCHPELTTWTLIKQALREKFGDKINRQVLTQQLTFLTKTKTETILEFIERIRLLKNRICLKINSENVALPTKQALTEQIEMSAVTVLLANTPSELRTILMFRNPNTIDEAYDIALNHSLVEQQIQARSNILSQRTPNTNFTPKQLPPKQTQQQIQMRPYTYSNNFVPIQQPNFNNFNPSYSNQSKPAFPSQPINIQSRPVPQRFFTNQQVFGKPTNVFSKENSNKNNEKPTPMSITTRNTTMRDRNPFNQRYNGQPSFGFQELTYVADDNPTIINQPQSDSSSSEPTAESEYSEQYYYTNNPEYDHNYPNYFEFLEQTPESLQTENFQIEASQKDTLT